jgi:hypothetical protein
VVTDRDRRPLGRQHGNGKCGGRSESLGALGPRCGVGRRLDLRYT